MNAATLTNDYTFINSTRMVGSPAPTMHIDNSVYTRVEMMLDQFINDRANIDYIRGFRCEILLPEDKVLFIEIDGMYVYWEKREAEDGEWYEPREVYPTWAQADLYDEEGERLPHDFDINIVIRRLTTH